MISGLRTLTRIKPLIQTTFHIPKVLYSTKNYTETHEWYIESGNKVKLGISQEALDQLSDIVYLDVEDIDFNEEFLKGSELCEIESVKAVATLYSPIDCKILRVNDALIEDLTELNKDPEDLNNWILELEKI